MFQKSHKAVDASYSVFNNVGRDQFNISLDVSPDAVSCGVAVLVLLHV
jgi:hypothetical protein